MPSEDNDRNLKLFEDVINGKTFKEVSGLYGVTHGMARQIFHHFRREMMRTENLCADDIPEHRGWMVIEMRKFKEFWISQLNKLKNKYNRNEHLPNTRLRS